MRTYYQSPPRSRVRRPKEKPFAGGTPHQHAAHDAGGALVYAPFDRDKWDTEMMRERAVKKSCAPGCGEPTHVTGTNGGTMPCGAKLHGKPYFCGHCQATQVVDSLLSGKKKPYWEREREKAHQDELERLRGVYGQDKTEPDERQAVVLRRLWRAGNHRRFMEYCRANHLNPNRVIASINAP